MLQSRAQHPKPHGADQAAVLQDGDELHRRHVAPAGRAKPKQCLRSAELVCAGGHLRLIEQGEAGKILLDGVLQLLAQLQSGQVLFIVLGREEPEGVLSLGLGPVQGVFRVLVQRPRVRHQIGAEGDCASGEGASAAQAPADLVEGTFHIRLLPAGEQHGKAVSVGPVDPALSIGGLLHGLDHLLEQTVSAGAAVFQVDGFQSIHTGQQQIAVRTVGQQTVQILPQHVQIECAGELIRQLGGHRVGNPAHHPQRHAAFVPIAAAAAVDPDGLAGAGAHPIVHLMGILFTLPDLLEVLQKRGQIPGIHQAAPLVKGAEVALFQKRVLGPDVFREVDALADDVPQEEVLLRAGAEQIEYIAKQGDGLVSFLQFHIHAAWLL